MRKQGLNWISRQKSRRFVYRCLQKTDSFFSFSLFFPFSTYSPTRTSDRSRRINYVSFHYRINTRSVHALKVCVCTPMCLPGVAQSIDRNIEIARAITALHQYLRETGDFTEFHAADLAIFGSRKVESEIVATCITFDEFSELVHADFPFSFFPRRFASSWKRSDGNFYLTTGRSKADTGLNCSWNLYKAMDLVRTGAFYLLAQIYLEKE